MSNKDKDKGLLLAGALGLGVFLLMGKPAGASPGDIVVATLTFDYSGDGGDYELMVRFGYGEFVEEETMGQHMLLTYIPESDSYTYSWDVVIPVDAMPGSYNAEGSILMPGMIPGEEWIIRAFQKNAITVL